MNDFFLLFLHFFIYSIIGWILEIFYCRLIEGKLYNRGFLHGPYCPIYGFGAILIVKLLNPLSNNAVLVFLAGAILTSTLEYITSFLMEKIFKAKWWDYSDMKFNINGRVCLLNSTLFGILGLLLVYILNPAIQNISNYLDIKIIKYISYFTFTFILIDLAITVSEFINLKKKLSELKDFTDSLIKQSNIFDQNSQAYKIMELTKEFNRTSGYNDIFITALKELSPSYSEYHQKLEEANKKLVAHYPEIEKMND